MLVWSLAHTPKDCLKIHALVLSFLISCNHHMAILKMTDTFYTLMVEECMDWVRCVFMCIQYINACVFLSISMCHKANI